VTASPDETPAPEASCDNNPNCTTDDNVHGEAAVTITLNAASQNVDLTSTSLMGSNGSVTPADSSSRPIVDPVDKSQTGSTCLSCGSEIMTASPFKNEQEQKEQEIAAKKMKLESRQLRRRLLNNRKHRHAGLLRRRKEKNLQRQQKKKKVSVGKSTKNS